MSKKAKHAVYFFILLGAVFRIIMVIVHYTHMDDIGVANYLIHLLRLTEDDEIGIAGKFSDFWTYGPFQTLITQKLVNENMSYSLNVIMGRLPSLLCNILFVFLIYNLLCKINEKEKCNLGIVLIICIVSLSWENIIYSAQMEPYSIGVLFSAIIIYFVMEKFYDSWYKTVLAVFLFTIGCYAQYQMFILVFAVYIVTFINNIRNKRNLIRVVFAGLFNFVFSTPLLLFLLKTGKLSLGVNTWNAGKDNIFLYHIVEGTFFNNIGYTIEFFIRNLFLCFKYLFLADSFKYISNILTVILLLCATFGIYYIHKNKEYRIFAWFHDAVTIVLLIMIINGGLTFGPSRHILFVEPIWLVLIFLGIVYLVQIIKVYLRKIIAMTICLIILLFVFSVPTEVATRKNLISEKYLCGLIDKYEPRFIFTEVNLNDLYLFNLGEFTNNSEPVGQGWLQNVDIEVTPRKNDTIILMSKNYSFDDIGNMDHTMRQQLAEKVNYFNLDTAWADLDNYTILYKKEVQTDAEVEYARKYYWNFPNGLYLYVLKYHEN